MLDPFRLNLPLTKTPEFLKKIADIIKQDYPCPNQRKTPDFTVNTNTLTPPEATKTVEKPKAMNFPISKITIGEWTSVMVYPDDLVAKFYFARKQLMWEILDSVETRTETHVAKLKRKIEIQWDDVLSFRATFHPHDKTGTFEVELGKRPTFFIETNPQAGKHTKWKQMEQDFTQDQSASRCRRHTLYFAPGVLQKNLEKLVSGDSFWSDLAKVKFPTLPQSLYFDIGDGNSNNNNRLFGGRSHMRNTGEFLGTQTNLMTGYGNSSNNNSDSQGSGRVEVGDSTKTDTRDGDGRHMGVIADDNRSEEVLGAQGMEQVRNTGGDSIRGERES
ncbi:unnamed protein product [Thlaspi arvense]|uniref:TRF2/HOY1 PH-like domain-containing protein n=1 Tax=Thlaspi arvense TaxID=13288 RepID=A0AAU9S5Z9_THLAR|nr:unnamed protein product [Thlaspi arvense]